MATIERGQFFIDHRALKNGKQKAKFFIALTDGDFDDDSIICFVINTEHRMDLYNVGCNRTKQRFILFKDIHKFEFLKSPSSIMLDEACRYFVKEFYEDNIGILDDKADENLCRQIKNCIDEGYILPSLMKLIKECYKDKPNPTIKKAK
jgi:hypothetical protein